MQAARLAPAAQPSGSSARTARRSRLPVRAAAQGASGSHSEPQPSGAAGQPSNTGGTASRPTPFCTELPGGALWWQHLHNSSTTPIYGTSFVLQRPRVGGPGLVRAKQQPKPVLHPARPPPPPPVVWQAPGGGAGLVLAGSSLGHGSVVIDTDFVVLPAQPEAPAVQPNTTCVGIVWQPAEGSEAQEQEQERAARANRRRSKHPRRTQAVSCCHPGVVSLPTHHACAASSTSCAFPLAVVSPRSVSPPACSCATPATCAAR